MDEMLVEPGELLQPYDAVVFDCRFSLSDPAEGRRRYRSGHIPGAFFLDLDEDLSGLKGAHGGRHPLPDPGVFAALLAAHGVGRDTPVVAYDDSRFAFAARLWWMMRALGYRAPALLNGGFKAYLAAGGPQEAGDVAPAPCDAIAVAGYRGTCDIDGLRDALAAGTVVVDSREPARYAGIEEPIDPVAGHIPGAVNRPWQGVTTDTGFARDVAGLRAHWGELLDAEDLVVYCGSGVTACANLFSLALLGRDDARLYAGSWSDWCSYLPRQVDDK